MGVTDELPPVDIDPLSLPPQPDSIAVMASIAPNRIRITLSPLAGSYGFQSELSVGKESPARRCSIN
ncbi:hypothetical protein [Sphingomonas faeni]|uniref:hypothetical protein n=1 Tax=Sphingomonas faeni TaxID=185950 RepID=UPI0020C08DBB|nr:hypothetical protein [Sphingomonas faeni]MCK8458489.1 hypothetical protein [Sphingomonas faeni]